jgi:hypothetical protein
MAPNQQKASRIPLALQVIFLHSNRGFNVDKPPPERQASKIFRRGLFFRKPIDPKSKSKADKNTTEEATSIKTQESSSVSTLGKGDTEEQQFVASNEVVVAQPDDKSKTSALTEQEDDDDDEEDESERKGTESHDEEDDESERKGTENKDGSDEDYSGDQSDSDFVFAAYEAEMEGLLQLLDFRLQSSRHLIPT